MTGIVYLVGGGPGDPDLLTLKGLRCLQQCDAVIYDALVNIELLNHCPPGAERVFVGKRRHRHTFEQREINAMMLHYARIGKKVCRLKGGDPFLFGRGGQEAEFLSLNAVPCEVVPGISSIIAVPAYAGIPLTHRDYASHITVITGQNSVMGKESQEDRWSPYHYLPRKTMVILMGFAEAENIAKRLLAMGWPDDIPAALICCGTHSNQLTVTGKLTEFGEKVGRIKDSLSAPAMIVIGEVVGMRRKISTSNFDIDLLPIPELKAHEEVLPDRVSRIKEEILETGTMLTPLWIDETNKVVLNGHHRLAALKELGCDYAPALLVDYDNWGVTVDICPGAVIDSISKTAVIEAALSGRLFPPRSSLHSLNFIPPNFVTALNALKKTPKESVKA